MVYPGNSELSSQAQERVVSAFRQVITKLQDGQREEAMIGLEFVLRLDSGFDPAVNLQQQLSSGAAEIDLSEIIAQLHVPTPGDIDELLVEAVEDYEQRDFLGAKEKVQKVLLDLPGHQDARQLMSQLDEALKVEARVGQFLAQAREALDRQDPQEAANFVMMAQALDPHHNGIADTLRDIQESGGPDPVGPPAPPEPTAPASLDDSPPPDFAVSFDTIEEPSLDFATAFDEPDSAEPPPADTEFSPSADWDADFATGSSDEIAADAAGDFTPPETIVDEGGEDFFTAEEISVESQPAFADDSFGLPAADDGPMPASDWPAEDVDDDSMSAEDGRDISDLFEEDLSEGEDGAAGEAVPTGPADDEERVEDLLQRGDFLAKNGDNLGAIHQWSQIFLVDASSRGAQERIAAARVRQLDLDRRVEQLLFEAQDAALSGDVGRAQGLVGEIRALQPQPVGAAELSERLAGAEPVAAQPAVAPELPDLEEDLFSEDAPAAPEMELELPLPAADEGEVAPTTKGVRRALPWRMLVIGIGAVAVILVGVWFGNRLLSGGRVDEHGESINRVLIQSQELQEQGHGEEAIYLLQDFLDEADVLDLDRSRIERRIEKYQEEMAAPTPTPVPTSITAAEEMLEQGLLLSAYGHTVSGLQADSRDTNLLILRDRIIELEERIPSLHSALQRKNYKAAANIAEELLRDHPEQLEYAQELRRCLFNAALDNLRGYNLTSAENYLTHLAELEPNDPEVLRVLRFVRKYKTRPVDPRLRIFIQSLSPR